MTRVAAITGASSGIGAETARALARDGFEVVRPRSGGEAVALDVTDPDSVEAFAAQLGRCDVLVKNAGGALGLGSLSEADEEQWRWMYDANVLGTMRMTRALLRNLRLELLGQTCARDRGRPRHGRDRSPWSASAATRRRRGASTRG